MTEKYTHALIVGDQVRQLFTSDPKLPETLTVVSVESSSDVEVNWVLKPDGSFEPPQVYLIPATVLTYKADIYRRCTLPEADAIEMALIAAPTRTRRLFESAQYLDHSAEEFIELRAAMVEMFGQDRADVLLAAS